MKQASTFKFKPFSRKQRQILNWWMDESPVNDYDGIIADGSIRAGKTVGMSLSFVIWAQTSFTGENFIMSGKTIGSFRRNVIGPLKRMLVGRGYSYEDKRSENLLEISKDGITNYYYVFGGKDEGVLYLFLAFFSFGIISIALAQSQVNEICERNGIS